MLAIPRIDLSAGGSGVDGSSEGSSDASFSDDPLDVARDLARIGFRRIHLLDLDAAASRGSNEQSIRRLLDDAAATVQVAGGVRTSDRVAELLHEGADWVVVGTRALEESDWAAAICSAYPGRIVAAIDVRERRLVTHGWTRETRRNAIDVVEDFSSLPLAALLVTALHERGGAESTDLALLEDIVAESTAPVLAGEAQATLINLRALDDRGLAGAVVQIALRSGIQDAQRIADEFGL